MAWQPAYADEGSTGKSASPAETPDAAGGIPYASVADAMRAVPALPGAKVSVTKPDAWTIVTEAGGHGMWSFVPSSHYAYPAVVRRRLVVAANGNVSVEMNVLCEAKKESCDHLVAEFNQLNERMRQSR